MVIDPACMHVVESSTCVFDLIEVKVNVVRAKVKVRVRVGKLEGEVEIWAVCKHTMTFTHVLSRALDLFLGLCL